MKDERYVKMKTRLNSLTDEELRRLAEDMIYVCTDEFNYDPISHRFCPLAVAKNLHMTLDDWTDESITNELGKVFKPVNILRGVPGKFYHGTHEQRMSDLRAILLEIMTKRGISVE